MRKNTSAARRLRLFAVFVFLFWTLLTLYPRPADLARSVYRVFNPPVDGEFVIAHAELFAHAETGREIDRAVRQAFPYQYDWVTYGMPWYFPSIDEAFLSMAGDCKTQLLVLASVLESRGIPYSIAVSPTHVWVEYDGKTTNASENALVTVFSSETGALQLPVDFDLRRSADSFWTAFWHYMPVHHKVSLYFGLALSVALFLLAGLRPQGFDDLVSGDRHAGSGGPEVPVAI